MIVALCGYPGSGKSTVQEILHRRFGILPVDDGWVLRKHCMDLFGLSEDDVLTQAGKSRTTEIQGTIWEHRKIIGEYGNALESVFGPLTVPNWALKTAFEDWETRLRLETSKERPVAAASKVIGYSFGSVRRDQGRAYLAAGGLVVEVNRKVITSSGNIWDDYDKELVTNIFHNDMPLSRLEESFCDFFDNVMRQELFDKEAA
jgi:hypothetical protein